MDRLDKIIRIQADKLCGYIGYEAGTKIPIETIEEIASSGKQSIVILGKEVQITPKMVALANILMDKIRK